MRSWFGVFAGIFILQVFRDYSEKTQTYFYTDKIQCVKVDKVARSCSQTQEVGNLIKVKSHNSIGKKPLSHCGYNAYYYFFNKEEETRGRICKFLAKMQTKDWSKLCFLLTLHSVHKPTYS